MNTKIISIAHIKGGVGKSVITLALANALAYHGKYKVLVIDGDYQGTCIDAYRDDVILKEIKEEDLPYKVVYSHPSTLFDTLQDAFGEYDVIFSDMPRITHGNEDDIISYYYNCNYLFIPMYASINDLRSLDKFIEIVRDIKDKRNQENVEFEYFGFANQKKMTRGFAQLPTEAEALDLPFMENGVNSLEIYKNLTVHEDMLKQKQAFDNFLPFYNEFLTKINLK